MSCCSAVQLSGSCLSCVVSVSVVCCLPDWGFTVDNCALSWPTARTASNIFLSRSKAAVTAAPATATAAGCHVKSVDNAPWR